MMCRNNFSGSMKYKVMKIRNHKFVSTNTGQWIIATLLSILLFSTTYLTTEVRFSTNDDMRIMYALAGYNTGEPYPYHPFINYFLGKFISMQYYYFPQIPWYVFFHIFCLFTGIVIIGKCFLKLAAKREISIIIPIFLHIIVYYTIMIFPVTQIQFSTTPAVLGSAAVILVFTLDIQKDSKGNIFANLITSVLLLILCYMTRSFTWYCIMCFYGLAVFYQLFHFFPGKIKQNWKKILLLCGSILFTGITVLILRETSLYLKDSVEVNKEFKEYNKYRADFQDYHMRLGYENNSEFYTELGWTRNTYSAALSLLFLDENINADNFQKITEVYKENTEHRTLNDAYETVKDIFEKYRVAKSGMAIIVILFITGIIVSFNSKKFRKESICLFFSFAGYLLMFAALGYRGRLPIRTFMVISVVETVVGASFLLNIVPKIMSKRVRWTLEICGVCMVLLSMYNIRAIYLKKEGSETQTVTSATMQQVEEFEKYALEHPEEVFVYDFTVATVQRNPFIVFPDKKPVNCIISGGSYTFSTIYYKQLAENGMTSLYWEDLLEDNMYYVTADSQFLNLVRDNLIEKTKKDIIVKECKSFGVSGVAIYKFAVCN